MICPLWNSSMLLQPICKRELPFMINIRQTRWDSETGFFPIIKLPGMRILELGCGTGDMWKNKEDLIRLCSRLTLSDFSKAMIAAAKSNIDDIIEYLYSLSSMTSITGIPKQAKKDILTAHTTNGILNVPKEYGMFIVS